MALRYRLHCAGLGCLVLLIACNSERAPSGDGPPSPGAATSSTLTVGVGPQAAVTPETRFAAVITTLNRMPLTIVEVDRTLRIEYHLRDRITTTAVRSWLDPGEVRQPCRELMMVRNGRIDRYDFYPLSASTFLFPYYYESLDRVVLYAITVGADGAMKPLTWHHPESGKTIDHLGPMGFALFSPTSRRVLWLVHGAAGVTDDVLVWKVIDTALVQENRVSLKPEDFPEPSNPFKTSQQAAAFYENYYRYLAKRFLGDGRP